jgi:hypothetical protein
MKHLKLLCVNLTAVSVFLLLALSGCSDEAPVTPIANFTIEKDTIINDKKVRVEVDLIPISKQVYIVSKSNAMFNSIWTGDSLKSGKNMIYHDYDMNKSIVGLLPVSKTDSTLLMKTASYQGVALPLGTVELAYKFQSKGVLKVTWIATNCTSSGCVSDKMQKTITVQ